MNTDKTSFSDLNSFIYKQFGKQDISTYFPFIIAGKRVYEEKVYDAFLNRSLLRNRVLQKKCITEMIWPYIDTLNHTKIKEIIEPNRGAEKNKNIVFKLDKSINGKLVDVTNKSAVSLSEYIQETSVYNILKSFATPESIGFSMWYEDIGGISVSKDILLSKFIMKLAESKPYHAFYFLVLTLFFPHSYIAPKSQRELVCEDYTDPLIKAIKRLYLDVYNEVIGLLRKEYYVNEHESEVSDSEKKSHITDNMDTVKRYKSFFDTIKGVAMKMHAAAREDCRLLPYNENKDEQMELPTLDVDTTVSNLKIERIELATLLQEANGNVMITGSGGCGKTYSLLYCAERMLSDDSEDSNIPFYIPLNTFNGSDFEGIEAYILGKIKVWFDNDYVKTEREFNSFLSDYGKKGRKLIFLCDGFNEVVSKELQTKIVQNIRELQHNDLYRFVITSRYNLSSTFANLSGDINNSGFTAYKVNDLDDEIVKEYVERFLINQGRSAEQTATIVSDELCELTEDSDGRKIYKVKDIYKKPMAIVMFCGLHSTSAYAISNSEFYSSINCLGELLHDFIMCIKIGNRSAENKDRYFSFLQYLGYRMNVEGVFTISKTVFNEYCNDFICDFNTPDMTAQGIFQNSFVNDVMKYESGVGNHINAISFNHQNFRDYFAASFLREFICECDYDKISEYIGIEKKIPNETSVLLAELLGEYRLTEKDGDTSPDKSLIQILLKNGPERLDSSAIAYLINIAVIGREKNLSEFDFSGLDLSLTQLNGVKLSIGSGKDRIKAKFFDSIVTKDTFAPVGHAGAPLVMFYVEDRFIISFSKNTICSFDMKKGVQRVVSEYSENVIESGVRIENSNKIITGDAVGILSLWEYVIENDELRLSLIKQYNLLDSVYMFADDERKKRTRIQSICRFEKNTVLFTVSCGDVFAVDIELNNAPSLKLSLCSERNEYSKFCCVKSIGRNFYVSYGNKIYKNKSELFIAMPMEQGSIYDFILVNTEGCLTILANFRGDKNNSDGAVSVIYKCNESKFDDPNLYDIITFKTEKHSVSSQGFTGWNRFSATFDNNSCAYLCANYNDDLMTPAVYKLSFDVIYDDDDDVEDIVVEYEAVFGNRHIMSVECVLPFVYNDRKYLATSSTDRSVEVLDVSSTENTLIYHLPGYTDGVTCMKVVDDKTIYTSHYSGEVCKWHKGKSGKWLCNVMSRPHSNWVWTVDSICSGSEQYIVGGSYDHSISITNDRTGRSMILKGCRGNIKTMEIVNNSIITAYNYKKDDSPAYEIAVYSDIDYAAGIYDLKHFFVPGFVRSMKRLNDELFLCVNSNFKSEIFRLKIKFGENKIYLSMNNKPVEYMCINKIENNKFRTQIRSFDITEYRGKKFFACGGDVGNYYMELWCGDDSSKNKVIINARPNEVLLQNDNYTENDGISTLKFADYDSEMYLIVGAYDHHTYIYRISFEGNGLKLDFVSAIENSDKVMNIQYVKETSQVYISLFNGKVYTWNMDTLVNSQSMVVEENSGELLFHAVTGLHIMGVDFTNLSTESDIPDDFRSIMKYYSKI